MQLNSQQFDFIVDSFMHRTSDASKAAMKAVKVHRMPIGAAAQEFKVTRQSLDKNLNRLNAIASLLRKGSTLFYQKHSISLLD